MRLKIPKYLTFWPSQASVCFLMLFLFVGCFANYGRYTRDAEVHQVFNSGLVPMEYRYYYYHSGSEPIAVIGVEKKYDAGSKMWRDVEPNTEKFKDLIYWIWADFGYGIFGAQILDPSGEQVGIMYTSVREVAFKFTDDNRIVVMPNTPFLWGELDDDEEDSEADILSADSNTFPSNRQMASQD